MSDSHDMQRNAEKQALLIYPPEDGPDRNETSPILSLEEYEK